MIRGILLALFSLMSGAAFAACATPSGPAYPPICYLVPPYDPNAQPYSPPKCTPVSPPALITGAFDRAHSHVQADLCRLDAIFIIPEGVPIDNIGVRENPARQGRGNMKKYIFLRSGLLKYGFGTSLAEEETALQNEILRIFNLSNINLQYSASLDNGT
jgi:hypothetical protein